MEKFHRHQFTIILNTPNLVEKSRYNDSRCYFNQSQIRNDHFLVNCTFNLVWLFSNHLC